MKIAFICNEYPPALHGGIGSVTQTLARSLSESGHHVRVIGIYRGPIGRSAGESDGQVQVWRLGGGRGGGTWALDRLRLFWRIRQWCRQKAIDIVEVPDFEGYAAGWPALPVPVVVRAHGSSTFFAAARNLPARRLQRFLERATLRRAVSWCAVSHHAASETRRLFSLASAADAVIYNGVDCASMPTNEKRDNRRVVFSGTLAAKKGIVSLARAWPAIRTACADAELHVFGKDGACEAGPSMRSHLDSLLGPSGRESVKFHGHVARGELFAALASARAAVFPSYAEALGLAPIEAMACGCPTIFSSRPPGPEVIRHRIDGLLVEPDRPEEIADAVVRLLTCEATGRQFSRSGRQRVHELFSNEKMTRSSLDFYGKCIAGHTGN